jgi:hypothetical protein
LEIIWIFLFFNIIIIIIIINWVGPGSTIRARPK